MKRITNKLSKLFLLLVFLATVFVKQSCKKADSFSTENNLKEAIEQKFFNGTQTADEVTKGIAKKFKEFKTKDENYIVSFVEKYGYPRWDKVQVSNSNTNNRSTTEEASIAIIPVVEEEATNVKTCIKSELTPAVTTIDIYELGYYQNLAFGNNTSKINTAEKWVLEFMQQTKIVFGVNSFRIIDKTVFQKKGYKPLHTRIVNIDRPTHQGIDAIFEKGGNYYIVEAKCPGNASDLLQTTDGKQMTDCWIKSCVSVPLNNQPYGNRIYKAVGENITLTDQIINTGYKRLVASVQFNGSVTYQEVDGNGNVIGVFTP